jgi:hypothetical protein
MQQGFPFYLILVLSMTCATSSETNAGGRRVISDPETNSIAHRFDVVQEKASRTPAQKKIDSQLLYAIYRQRGEAEAKGVPAGELGVKYDDKGRAIVSIRARVTKTVLAKIKSAGGKIISTSERYHDIRAHIPLKKLEALAALKDVTAIMPAEEATTNDAKLQPSLNF